MKIIRTAQFIEEINSYSGCVFNENLGIIEIVENNPAANYYYDTIYNKLVKYLTENKPEDPIFRYPTLEDMSLSFYSGCLYRYIYDVKNLNMNHKETCFYKNVECSRLVGFTNGDVERNTVLSTLATSKLKDVRLLEEKFEALSLSSFCIEGGWLKYRDLNIRRQLFGIPGIFVDMVRRIKYGPHEKVLKLIDDICAHGFSVERAYGEKVGVLGFSELSGDYSVFHGKHRVAALKYLSDNGLVESGKVIEFPVVRYPFRHFGNSSGQQCKNCGVK